MDYKIYQLDCIEANQHYLFASLDLLKKLHLTHKNKEDYRLVYSGNIAKQFGAATVQRTPIANCEKLFTIFNTSLRPEDFKGHSMSVSDVVEIQGEYYYCDDWGFEKLENF